MMKEKLIWGENAMGKKVGATVYSLSVWNGDKRVRLDDICDGNSFLEYIEEFASKKIKKIDTDTDKEEVFLFDEITTETIVSKSGRKKYDILYGRVKTGEYGIESELVNISNGDVYERKREQADIIPFGFCIAVPAGEVDKAVIVLQTLGNYGMKLALQKKIDECIRASIKDHSVLWGQIYPKAYIDKFFNNGELKKIRMIRYEIPEDISNRVGINYGVRQTKEERIIYRPIGFLERKKNEISEWMSGQRSFTQIIELEDFEYDDLKLEFELGRTNKTFSLGDTRGLQVTEDITDEINIVGSNPEYGSLKAVLKKISEEYLLGMGFLSNEGDK